MGKPCGGACSGTSCRQYGHNPNWWAFELFRQKSECKLGRRGNLSTVELVQALFWSYNLLTHTQNLKQRFHWNQNLWKKFFFFLNIFCKYSQHIVWNITWKTKKENDCLPLLYILTLLPITFHATFISTESTCFAFLQNQSHNKTPSLIPSF